MRVRMEKRETFSGKIGFILACIGAAIGLGNIWMFPWRLGSYGGAAFLIPYLFFILVLGTTGLMGEFAFGRNKKRGAIGAFKEVFKEKNLPFGSLLGAIPVIGVSGVFVFYLIVVGWILKYFILALTNGFATVSVDNIPAMFGGFAGQPQSIVWHMLAIIITLIIVNLGVVKGIEKANKYMMPTLFAILIVLGSRSLTLPGALEGLKFLFIPDWALLKDPTTWIMALGQSFFTVSLGGAAMLVYGSYLKDDVDIPESAIHTAIFNTCASFLAALVIIPAVFAFGLSPQAGPTLLFITIPNILKLMPGGYIFGTFFFLSIFFAALSSALNLMEVPVEALMDRFNISRRKSAIIVGTLGFLIGIPLDLNINLFGKFADFVSIYLIPLGAVLAAIVFFWVFGVSRAREEINKGANKPLGVWWEFVAKYVFTIVAVIVLVLGVIYGGIG